MDFTGARDHILERLEQGLDRRLCYHNLAHTLDVHKAVENLSRTENIPPHSRLILETAAYYHDSGMLVGYQEHEKHSIFIAREILPSYHYSPEEIDEVEKLIQVTTIPQQAQTQLEKIICDADLDNLGREDFFIQSFCLKLEWEYFNIRSTTLHEWLIFEQKFLEVHKYYTASARNSRDAQKRKNLNQIRELIHHTKNN